MDRNIYRDVKALRCVCMPQTFVATVAQSVMKHGSESVTQTVVEHREYLTPVVAPVHSER